MTALSTMSQTPQWRNQGEVRSKKERLDDDFVKEACAQGSLNAPFDEEGDSADADVCWLAGWVPGTSRFS